MKKIVIEMSPKQAEYILEMLWNDETTQADEDTLSHYGQNMRAAAWEVCAKIEEQLNTTATSKLTEL